MIFLSDIEGTITAIVPEKIYQGSSNAKELILIGPFPKTSAVSVSIRLPNGVLIPPFMANSYELTSLPDFSPALYDNEGRVYNAWRMQLNSAITSYDGDLTIQFLIATSGDVSGVIESTSECVVNIGRGVPYILPVSIDENWWNDILNAFAAIDNQVFLLGLNLKDVDRKVAVIPGEGEDSAVQRYTGARAPGKNSVALNSSVAGCKGYRYKAIDLLSQIIYLTTDDVTGTDIQVRTSTSDTLLNVSEEITLPYVVGDKFTLKMRSYDLDDAGTITFISGNAVYYGDDLRLALEKVATQAGLEGSTITAEIQKTDTYIDRHSFSVPRKPTEGAVVVSEDAAAFGTNDNIATGRHSFSTGRSNLSVGDFSFTAGRGNVSGYGSAAFGYYNEALGDRCGILGGAGNVTRAPYSFLSGNSNLIIPAALCGFGAGMFNEVTNPFETVFGRAGKPTNGALFRIGNGTLNYSEGNPTGVASFSNAFAVFQDGHVEAYSDPVNGDTLVRLGYLPFRRGSAPFSLIGIGGSNVADSDGSIAWGVLCTAHGAPSIAFGESCYVAPGANFGIALGKMINIRGYAQNGIGFGLETLPKSETRENCFQTVLGAYNIPLEGATNTGSNDGARLIVGNGVGVNDRSNALVVWGDGRVEIGAYPVETMDAVNKGYLDTKLGDLSTILTALHEGGIE